MHTCLRTPQSTIKRVTYSRSSEDARVGSREAKTSTMKPENQQLTMARVSSAMARTISSSICRISRIFRLGCTLPTRQTTGPYPLLTQASPLAPTCSLTSVHPSPCEKRQIKPTFPSPMHTFTTVVEMKILKLLEDTRPASLVIIASSGSRSATSILLMYARLCTSTRCLTILPWATTSSNRRFCSAVTTTLSEFKKPSSSQSSLASILRTSLRPSATRSRKNMYRFLNSTRVLVTSLPHSRSLASSTKVAILAIPCLSGSTTSANTPLIRVRLSAAPLTISSSLTSRSPYGTTHVHPSEYTSMPRTIMRRPFQTRYSCLFTNG